MPQLDTEESRVSKNFRVGLIEIIVRNQLYRIRGEQGNFTLAIPGPTVEVYLKRGRLYDPDDPDDEPDLAYGQDQPMTGSFTAFLRDTGSEEYDTLADIIANTGRFFSRWGTDLKRAGPDSPKVATLQFWLKGARVGDPRNKGFRLRFCAFSGNIAEGSPTQLTVNFTSYSVKPEPARWQEAA